MTKEQRSRALQNQIRRLQQRIAYLENLNDRYTWVRLVVFGVGVVIAAIVFFLGYPQWFWLPLALAIVIFLVLVQFHHRVERSLARHRIWLRIKQNQVGRLTLSWSDIPKSAQTPETALERDLDLVGPYSLNRLINTAASSGGTTLLRQWLASPNTHVEESQRRQDLVRELAPLPLFRDKLTLNGTYAAHQNKAWEPEQLLTWLNKSPLPASLRPWFVLLILLGLTNIVLFVFAVTGLIPPIWRFTFVAYAVLFLIRSRELGEPFKESAQIRDALEQLRAVFGQLEKYNYARKPNLAVLCQPFLDQTRRPSYHLKRINWIVSGTGIRGNPFFWLILNIAVPWDYFFALQLDKYRREMSQQLPIWLDLWFELEALGSLANIAYLNPHYIFPEFLPSTGEAGGAVFRAAALGHPLIPDDACVCNDFSVSALGEIALFTGSNMSGKSTFLRTVGVSLVLAYAGGPVNASLFQTIPFRLFSCIRITDSIADGISYFYAEVKCLKSLLDELEGRHPSPLLFFIDEIFRGTNNRERLIGSRSYIQAVSGRSGVGLIATHDLELVHLAGENSAIKNYHFTDHVQDGQMIFDYRLHSGPSPTTNAVKIMRMEGLPV